MPIVILELLVVTLIFIKFVSGNFDVVYVWKRKTYWWRVCDLRLSGVFCCFFFSNELDDMDV